MGVSRDLVHLDAEGGLRPSGGPRGARTFWPYTQSWRHMRRRTEEALVDPVNLLVLAPLGVVEDALVAASWEIDPAEGGVHYLWGRHLPRRMASHAALGPPEERDHVRLWPMGDATVVAAHHEVRAEGGGHRVTSWDAARAVVAEAVVAAGMARADDAPMLTLPGVRGCASDGRIWRFLSPKGVMVGDRGADSSG